MLKAQIDFENVSDDVIKYISEKSTDWEVIPGCLMSELELSSLDDFVNLMKECDKLEGHVLSYNTRYLEPVHKDDEEMIYITIFREDKLNKELSELWKTKNEKSQYK